MSADNWSVCPRCRRREESRILELQRRADEGYGSLPVEQFDALRAEAAKGIDEDALRTFREDYEFYGADEGTVTAMYNGHCGKCGLGLDFKHDEVIPGVDEA